MRYVLDYICLECDGWFTTFKGKSLIELGRQLLSAKRQYHKYRVSKEKKYS